MTNLVRPSGECQVDSLVHVKRTLDLHLSASSKVDQAQAIFICSFMQAVFANRRRVVNYFPTDFRTISHCSLKSIYFIISKHS
jgi:hypothetical protein